MANHHYEKWIIKAPVGFLLIGGGVFFMYYSLTQLGGSLKETWVYFGLSSAVAISIGVFILCVAFVHKIKSDLIKKTKLKNQSD